MRQAKADGRLVTAGPSSPHEATCPACGGIVEKRQRRDGGRATYFYRHKNGEGDSCPLRYRPVAM